MRGKGGWFLRQITMIMAYSILNVTVAYSETPILTVYHYKRVLKACDYSYIVSSACNLRRHWAKSVGRVKRIFCFTGAIDVLKGAVVRRPIGA